MIAFASRHTAVVFALAAVLTPAIAAQGARGGLGRPNPNLEAFQAKRIPHEPGFRAYIVSNMAGMGAAVDPKEVLSGTERGAPAQTNTASFADYDPLFRRLLTQEANAAVQGARKGGAVSFVVSDAHPGNAFGNILPWELDSAAVLVRGFPRPLFMISGIDSTFGTLMFDGAVASAGSQGIMPHTFGFSALSVNGIPLNEVAVSALIAGEMGVSVSMVAGDDAAIAETQQMLGNGFVPVITKYAVGRIAGITYSPAKVRQMVAAGAAEAVRREKAGEFKPFTMARPYRVEFTLQPSMSDEVVDQVAALPGFTLEKTGPQIVPLHHRECPRAGLPDRRDPAGGDAMRAGMRSAIAVVMMMVVAIATVGAQSRAASSTAAEAPPLGDADTLPPYAYFGITEYDLARNKLEALVKPGGFAVMIVTDMEGLAGVVNNGREMSNGRTGYSPDHQKMRQELTDELNAAIAGARAGGATQFFVVEGHGANNFRNVLVDKVDPDAMLLRGWPRPNVMETGINAKIDLLMVVGNHPNAGTPGIIAHSYALGGPLTVNGVPAQRIGDRRLHRRGIRRAVRDGHRRRHLCCGNAEGLSHRRDRRGQDGDERIGRRDAAVGPGARPDPRGGGAGGAAGQGGRDQAGELPEAVSGGVVHSKHLLTHRLRGDEQAGAVRPDRARFGGGPALLQVRAREGRGDRHDPQPGGVGRAQAVGLAAVEEVPDPGIGGPVAAAGRLTGPASLDGAAPGNREGPPIPGSGVDTPAVDVAPFHFETAAPPFRTAPPCDRTWGSSPSSPSPPVAIPSIGSQGGAQRCAQGDMAACDAFGTRLEKGRYVLRDLPRAATLLDTACGGGIAAACARLGSLYLDGRGVDADSVHAAALFETACAGGAREGCGQLGVRLAADTTAGRDAARAAMLLAQACDSTTTIGCVALGHLLAEGDGIAQDAARAARVFALACNDERYAGCFAWANALETGTGVALDAEHAATLYRDTCESQYHGESCFRLGLMYQRGEGVPASAGEAAILTRRACRMGYRPACPPDES